MFLLVGSLSTQQRKLYNSYRNIIRLSISSKIMDGVTLATRIRSKIKEDVINYINTYNVKPSLSVVLVGNKHESATSLEMKRKACSEVGISNNDIQLPENISQDELITKIKELNFDPTIHGIIVQLPLPSHINDRQVLDNIDPIKDVDGLHSSNIYRLLTQTIDSDTKISSFKNISYHLPCTPQGCMALLEAYNVPIEGKDVVVIGRSNIVGLPMAIMLIKKSATVTILHSHSVDIQSKIRRADIVVAAMGKAEFIKGDWLKPGAVVIDVGINTIPDSSTKRGYKIVGDVEFSSVSQVASLITPVPGGVGPMTIAMLLKNTLDSYKTHFDSVSQANL
eukprot:gene6319-12784_t